MGLLPRSRLSPKAAFRLRVLSAAGMILVAGLGWWGIVSEGATPARVIAAVAGSLAGMLQTWSIVRGKSGGEVHIGLRSWLARRRSGGEST